LDAGIRAGQLFAPMHWNDQFASDGRIAKLIPSVTDPVSGQPESKFVAVSVARCEVKSWASLLSIEPLDMSTFDFWIRTPLASEAGAARYEVAMFREDTSKLAEMIERVVGAKPDVRFDDEKFAAHRMIFAAGGSVRTLAFLGRHHESLPAASWSNDLFKMRLLPNAWTLLAGKSPSGADKGRLVCSCYEVGENQIIGEILRGACTTRALGEKLSCGTNCGSCLPELRSLIAEHGLQEESAA
ncbi:MAG: (2Fe-2S)-binding protein, partial [bacterium]